MDEKNRAGQAVAARVGANIRQVRTKKGMTQALLAEPEYSISYISAIERGKIRPSLKALSILCRRLDVPITFILEGTPSAAGEAMATGYRVEDAGPDQKIELQLLSAQVYLQQGDYFDAKTALEAVRTLLNAQKVTTNQALSFFMLSGEFELALKNYQEAVAYFQSAISQATATHDNVGVIRARDLVGYAYHLLNNDTLALKEHETCLTEIEATGIDTMDPLLAAQIYGHLSEDYSSQENREKAQKFAEKASELLAAFGKSPRLIAIQWFETAERYRELGNLSQAAIFMQSAQGIYFMLNEQTQHLKTLLEWANLHQAEGNVAEAQEIYKTVAESANSEDMADTQIEAVILLAQSHIIGDNADLPLAKTEIHKALATTNKTLRGRALIVLGQILEEEKKMEEADAAFSEAFQLLAGKEQRQAYNIYGSLLEKRGDIAGALKYYKLSVPSQM